MSTEYVIFYSEASLVCIVILSILLLHDILHSTKQEKQIWFNRSIISFYSVFYIRHILGRGAWRRASQSPLAGRVAEPVELYPYERYGI